MYNKFRTNRRSRTPFDRFRAEPITVEASYNGEQWQVIGRYTDQRIAMEVAEDMRKCYKYVRTKNLL